MDQRRSTPNIFPPSCITLSPHQTNSPWWQGGIHVIPALEFESSTLVCASCAGISIDLSCYLRQYYKLKKFLRQCAGEKSCLRRINTLQRGFHTGPGAMSGKTYLGFWTLNIRKKVVIAIQKNPHLLLWKKILCPSHYYIAIKIFTKLH